jgi:hypothetical protein
MTVASVISKVPPAPEVTRKLVDVYAPANLIYATMLVPLDTVSRPPP